VIICFRENEFFLYYLPMKLIKPREGTAGCSGLWGRRGFTLGLFCTATVPVWANDAAKRTLVFRVPPQDLARYQAYMQSRNPSNLNDIGRTGLTRHVAEMWLFQTVVAQGGCGCQVEFQSYQVETTHARTIAEISAGRQLSDPIAGFREDSRYGDGVWFSEPILDGDDFLVGIYTHQSRTDVLNQQEASRLRDLTYVIARGWEVDRKVLKAKGLRWVEADNWASALRLIEARRADAILQPFSNQARRALGATGYEAAFVPVPGFMLRFGYGRHYTVSKKHPEGVEFLRQIDAGLRLLRDSGFIQRLWLASGVIHTEVRQFQEVR
jgi:hypothetical protein